MREMKKKRESGGVPVVVQGRRAVRRGLSLLFAVLLLMCGLSLPLSADEAVPDTSKVGAVYLLHMQSGTVIYEKNARQQMDAASTVKVLAGLVAVEALGGEPDKEIAVTSAMLSAASGYRMYLKEGETVTVEDMLRAAIVGSYNDAFSVLAFAVSGSEAAFMQRVNERAAELGATGTHYTSPTGLGAAVALTTAADTARVARAALGNEQYRALCGLARCTVGKTNLSAERTVTNRNALISRSSTAKYYNASVYGLSAGSTTEGGACVVSAAARSGADYLCVVMGGEETEEENYAYLVTNALYRYAFAGYAERVLLGAGQVVATVPVELAGAGVTVDAYVAEEVRAYLPTNVNAETDLSYHSMLSGSEINAPVKKGQEIGVLTVRYGEQILASVPLYAGADVEANAFLVALNKLTEYTSGRPFILFCVYAVVLLFGYFAVLPWCRRRRTRKKQRYF